MMLLSGVFELLVTSDGNIFSIVALKALKGANMALYLQTTFFLCRLNCVVVFVVSYICNRAFSSHLLIFVKIEICY